MISQAKVQNYSQFWSIRRMKMIHNYLSHKVIFILLFKVTLYMMRNVINISGFFIYMVQLIWWKNKPLTTSIRNKWLFRRPDLPKSWRTTSFQTCGCPWTSMYLCFSSSPWLADMLHPDGQPEIVTWLSVRHLSHPSYF